MEPPLSYQFRTTPFGHQLKTFNSTRDARELAVFWEQGTGKTKLIIDDACDLYQRGEIDAVVIVAPNGVHRNWMTDEIPVHAPESVLAESRMMFYQASKATTKGFQAQLEALRQHKGLIWFAISYDAFVTERGKAYVWKLLQRRRVLQVLDESHKIKTPGAKRTKSIVASGRWATRRRVLTGTPIANGPFDVWSPMKFLQQEFWVSPQVQAVVPGGFASFAAFKTHFGLWRTAAQVKEEKGYDPGYDQLLGYRNLDQLQTILAGCSTRVLKSDVLDLPPKLFSKRYTELSSIQRQHYEEIKEEFMTLLASGELITVQLAITRLLRLQQVVCGYLPSEDEDRLVTLGNRNERLAELMELVETIPHQCIIWARFTADIDQIMEALTAAGYTCGRYDGKGTDDENAAAKEGFQRGELQFFVGNHAKGSEGLTLHAAKTVIYYSNSFKLLDRLQSEDRAHRAGMDDQPVQYIDLVAADTVDDKIIKALRKKVNIASEITGDELKEWL